MDRNLGKQFPRILEGAGLAVERHDDHFPPNTLDEEWLPEVGRRKWIAITRDKRIRFKPNEKEAVLLHHVAMIVLIGDAPYPDLARNFVSTRKQIEQFVANSSPPYIAKVYRPTGSGVTSNNAGPGRVERWFP